MTPKLYLNSQHCTATGARKFNEKFKRQAPSQNNRRCAAPVAWQIEGIASAKRQPIT